MLARKHTLPIIAGCMVLAVCLCLCAVVFSDSIAAAVGDSGVTMEYESALFQTDTPITINILMEEEEWTEMLENAISETYYSCDVEVNGKTFYRVGIRPKGNTSLTSIVNDPTTDRYSFKLEFDQFVEGQTCYGLDKLILNNNYADATNMKEALVYDLFQSLGADASLYQYATLSVNGDYRGVYLALEAVEDSFLLRNYGVANGTLYKPEGMGMGGDGGGFSMNSGGANLNYSDDDLSSYETIWDGAVTKSTTADHQRVVTALKNIAEGNNLADFMDIDNLLRYLAVHVFSVNEDSLSGSMAHNYYLYESNGQLNLLPWDYNLAFGGMGMNSSATGMVNDAIDDVFSITNFFDTLLADETYHSQYYAYLRQVVDYVENGEFDAFYARIREQIDALVETDPTAFYTYDEYLTAVDTLYQVVTLRAASIDGQLNGSIPSTASEQKTADTLVDASSLTISAMGTMNMGGGGGGGKQEVFGKQPNTISSSADAPSAPPQNSDSNGKPQENVAPSQNGGEVPDGFDPSQNGGELPDGFDPSQSDGELPDGFDPSQNGGELPDGFDPSQSDGELPDNVDFSQFGNGNMPSRGERHNGMGETSQTTPSNTILWCVVSVVVLLVALGFALCFRRRPR